MKTFRPFLKFLVVLTWLMIFTSSFVKALNYYSAGNTDASVTTNWWSNINGTGSHPTFLVATDVYVVQNPHSMTQGAAWTIAGSLQINPGGTLTTGANVLWTVTIGGTTSVTGTLVLSGSSTKTFTGDITVNSGGIWSIDNTTAAILAPNITVSAGGTMKHFVNYISANIITMTGNLSITGTYTYTGFTPAIFMNAPSGTRTINTGTTSVFYLLLRTATYNAVGPVTVDGPFYAMWNVNSGSFHTNGQTIVANWGIVNAGGTFFIDGGS